MTYKPISVSEINRLIKEKIESEEIFKAVCVKGEVSNYKKNISGHIYFTLKDEKSVIKCVMFKGHAQRQDTEIKDGDSIFALSTVTTYPMGGYYQLQVVAIKKIGAGDLNEKKEELRRKLALEGLFDIARKKEIPKFVKKVGVITSRTGAVIHDILNVSKRRNPGVEIHLYPVAVQGENAKDEIVEGIKYMNFKNEVDVLIVGRGGGSIEDLWAFNEEIVIKAIAESKIPVIAAVGHETDKTLTDDVADKVAPTPSAAAELAVPNLQELKERLTIISKKFNIVTKNIIKQHKYRLESYRLNLEKYSPKAKIDTQRIKLDILIERMEKDILKILDQKKNILDKNVLKLEEINPLKILKRGYTVVEKENNIISSVSDLTKGEKIQITFADGKISAKVD